AHIESGAAKSVFGPIGGKLCRGATGSEVGDMNVHTLGCRHVARRIKGGSGYDGFPGSVYNKAVAGPIADACRSGHAVGDHPLSTKDLRAGSGIELRQQEVRVEGAHQTVIEQSARDIDASVLINDAP